MATKRQTLSKVEQEYIFHNRGRSAEQLADEMEIDIDLVREGLSQAKQTLRDRVIVDEHQIENPEQKKGTYVLHEKDSAISDEMRKQGMFKKSRYKIEESVYRPNIKRKK